MRSFALPVVGTVILGGGLLVGGFYLVAGDDPEEVTTQLGLPTATTASDEGGSTVAPPSKFFGWGNVTLSLPDNPEIYASSAQIEQSSTGIRGIKLIRDTDPSDLSFSYVLLNAETGKVVEEEVLENDRRAIDDVLSTVKVDPLTSNLSTWPHDPLAPLGGRVAYGNLSYIYPPPEARLEIGGSLNDPGGHVGLSISDGRSTLVVAIDPSTSKLISQFHGADDTAKRSFERWLAEVKICGIDIEC